MSADGCPVRTLRERVVQTLWFEAIGLALVTPLWSAATGADAGASLLTLASLSVAVMLWTALFNTAFDHAEARRARRVASDRPLRWRIVHAVGLEASSVLVSLPLIVATTELSWLAALAADIGLTLAYAAYGYGFHLVYDHLRPVRPPAPRPD